jgi:hypothetical protein
MIGPVILKMEELRHEMEQINERLIGATHPESIGQYHNALREKREAYNALKADLRELRNAELIELQDAKKKVESELELDYLDAWDIQEKEGVLRDITTKIETLTKVIAHENNVG